MSYSTKFTHMQLWTCMQHCTSLKHASVCWLQKMSVIIEFFGLLTIEFVSHEASHQWHYWQSKNALWGQRQYLTRLVQLFFFGLKLYNTQLNKSERRMKVKFNSLSISVSLHFQDLFTSMLNFCERKKEKCMTWNI